MTDLSNIGRMDAPPAHRIPCYNVDRLNIGAGVTRAIELGWDSSSDQMLVEYALQRHARGEEDGCQRSMLSHGIDLTSYYVILATATGKVYQPKHRAEVSA